MLESKRWSKSYAGKAMQHPMFRQNPMNYGAFMYLIWMAAWKQTRFNVKGKTITLKRGQLCASEKQLGETFGTSSSWARRFLQRLKTEAMIEVETEAGKNIITICNYSKYQDETQHDEAAVEVEPEAEVKWKRSANIEGLESKLSNSVNTKTIVNEILDFSNSGKSEPEAYAFAGAVIRLNQADLEKWKSIYHAIPDLIAELHQLDDYYATQPADEVKNWFHRAKSALNKKHQARLQARADAGAAAGPTSGGLGETDYAAMRRRQAERDEAEAREIARNLAGGGETMEFHETAYA
jgi:hypothetical protein